MRTVLRKYAAILSMMFCCLSVIASNDLRHVFKDSLYTARYSLHASIHYGTIFKHTSKFAPEISEASTMYELGFSYQDKSSKDWQRRLNYPSLGINLLYADFGNREIFGRAYGIVPNAKIVLARTRPADFLFHFGFGLAYLDNPYDHISNSGNNVIGSHINNISQFKLGVEWKLHKSWHLNTHASFTHFSNAKFQNPNLGINVVAANMGLAYLIQAEKTVLNRAALKPPPYRHELSLICSAGMEERGKVPGGPKFNLYNAQLEYAFYTSCANKVGLSLFSEYHQAEYESNIRTEMQLNRFQTTDISILLRDEVLFGKIGATAGVGLYLQNKVLKYKPIFARLGLRMYLWNFDKKRYSLSHSISLKTHYTQAEYFDVGLGFHARL